jgi:hypothetical protein
MVRILGLACVVTLLGALQAAGDTHHNGQRLLGGKIRQSGKHVIYRAKGHAAHAHVQNGRVQRVSVTRNGRAVQVKKFKTSRRHHAMADRPGEVHFVMAEAQVTAFVGFGFFNQATQQWIIFWFPVNLVAGQDTGATDIDNPDQV